MDTAEFTSKVMRAQSQADRFIGDLKRQADTFGMTAREAKRYQLALSGATAEQLAQIRRIDESLSVMERQEAATRTAIENRRTLAEVTARLKREEEDAAKKRAELEAFGRLDASRMRDRAHYLEQLAEQERKSVALGGDEVTSGGAFGVGFFSKRGPLGKFAQLLRGGGAVAGIVMAAREIGAMAQRFDESRKAGDTHQITLLKTLPVVNQLYGAFLTLGNAIYGGTDALKAFDAQQKEIADKKTALASVIDQVNSMMGVGPTQADKLIADLQAIQDVMRSSPTNFSKELRQIEQAMSDIAKLDAMAMESAVQERTATREQSIKAAMDQYAAMIQSPREQAHAQLSGLGGSTAAEHARIDLIYDLIDAEEKRRESMKKTIQLQEEAYEAAQREAKQIEDFAETIKRENMTPLEKFNEQVRKLDEALMSGFLDDEDYRRAIERITEQEKDSTGKSRSSPFTSAPGLNLLGTASAASAERLARAADTAQREPLERISRQQAAANRELEEIKRNTRRALDYASQPADVG